MATSPTGTFFLESFSAGQQSHDSEFIAADISRVYDAHPETAIAGSGTDNISTNKKA
jgi:hypothetical protein